MLTRLFAVAACLAAMMTCAYPQAGQFQSGYVQGNSGASAGQAAPSSVTSILDRALGSARGSVLRRGAGGWATVTPGTAGLPWVSNGPGADPAYQILGIAGGGTNCGGASGTCLDNITGFSSTGLLNRTGASTYAFVGLPLSIANGGTNCAVASGVCLDNITGFSGTGLISRTGSGSYAFTPSASLPSVTIESQGGGCGVADNTAALNAAVASVSGAVRVLFPNNCNYTFTQSNALIFNKAVYIEGNGPTATVLVYNPTSNGTFLNWSNGVNVMFNGGVSKIGFSTSDTTHQKTAIYWADVSGFLVSDISINGSAGWTDNSGTKSSIGLYPHGRDTTIIRNVIINANQPIRIGMNPHAYQSADVYHFQDLQLISDLSNLAGNHVIAVDPGVIFTNTTFDGEQSWNAGADGFSYIDTAAANNVSATVSGGSGYSAGQLLTVTGGTCSTPIQIQVLSAPGGVIAAAPNGASIANPGVCSVTPANPVSVNTGSATFNLQLVAGYRLKFANVRSEQGYSTSAYTFNIQPKAQLQGFTVENSLLDPARCGSFIKNTFFARFSHTTGLGNAGCTSVVDFQSANGNDMLQYDHDFWLTGVTHNVAGMTGVYFMASPTGTSTTVPPEALYSSTASGFTFGNLAASAFTLGSSNIGTAWSTYTPTIACQAGTITTLGTVTGAYKIIGKTVFVTIQVPITTIGSCTGFVSATFPPGVTANRLQGLVGKDVTSGKMVNAGFAGASTSAAILFYDGTSPAASGANLLVSGVMEQQ